MSGGTLLVSRNSINHARYKKRLEQLGFRDVSVTDAARDGLTMVINEVKPRQVLMSSHFYKSATPYLMGRLTAVFPSIVFSSVSLAEYPVYLAMSLVMNGVRSYVNYWDGAEQFYEGLEYIRAGKHYISPAVQKEMDTRRELPRSSTKLTDRELEVLRLVCSGFISVEIAETIHVSKRTVDFHKLELYEKLAVRNEIELMRAALYLGIINVDDLDFYGGTYNERKINKTPLHIYRGYT